ncbi:MAG: hypothetical protein IPL52_11545 [Flavobacteriales bacterium]|nr:hypothetical protein [Flavobacteriales bacterium]
MSKSGDKYFIGIPQYSRAISAPPFPSEDRHQLPGEAVAIEDSKNDFYLRAATRH